MIDITFNVKPVPKGRPRFARIGKFVSTYTPKVTRAYETLIKSLAKKENIRPDPNPVAVSLDFYLSPPRSLTKSKRLSMLRLRHAKKPDADNLTKSVIDALIGTAMQDDSQIFSLNIRKEYREADQIRYRQFANTDLFNSTEKLGEILNTTDILTLETLLKVIPLTEHNMAISMNLIQKELDIKKGDLKYRFAAR